MKNLAALTLLSLSPAAFLAVDRATDSVSYEDLGFSIDQLDFDSEEGSFDVLRMFLPPDGGFSPNVSVQRQEFTGSIEEYIALSRTQSELAGFDYERETVLDDESVLFEYEADSEVLGIVAPESAADDTRLRFYAKATITGEEVFLATAVAKASHGADLWDPLEECVDSLAVD